MIARCSVPACRRCGRGDKIVWIRPTAGATGVHFSMTLAEGWAELIGVVIFVLIWIIGTVSNVLKEQRQRQKRDASPPAAGSGPAPGKSRQGVRQRLQELAERRRRQLQEMAGRKPEDSPADRQVPTARRSQAPAQAEPVQRAAPALPKRPPTRRPSRRRAEASPARPQPAAPRRDQLEQSQREAEQRRREALRRQRQLQEMAQARRAEQARAGVGTPHRAHTRAEEEAGVVHRLVADQVGTAEDAYAMVEQVSQTARAVRKVSRAKIREALILKDVLGEAPGLRRDPFGDSLTA